MTDILKEKYARWLKNVSEEARKELLSMNEDAANDAFYRDLAFGTGGLRGKLGVGSNRMNEYTVAKATQGLADYILSDASLPKRVAVSFDSRLCSEDFSKTASSVMAANGIEVYRYDTLMPTPMLSFAVRALRCAAGIMITASHNPSVYNGYKVYGKDGCQITDTAADAILKRIDATDPFDGVKRGDYGKFVKEGRIKSVPESVITAFVEEVKKQSCLFGENVGKNVSIVYSPLNGTGLVPVTRVLKESGFTDIHVVEEQRAPDGHFPTCPYPNPEIREAMALGLRDAKRYDADLLLATDPDCDRVGIAVRNDKGEHILLTGNETGVLLFNYICERRSACGKMPENPVLVKTVVTTDMALRVAAKYGVTVVDVLTGFKYIGEQIARLEEKGRKDDYIFGFEESYGCLSGTYVRDKDAVNGAFLICEMFAYYASKGISLYQKLRELYRAFGCTLCTLHSYTFEGESGMARMASVMKAFRSASASFGGKSIEKLLDYDKGIDGLPRSDVLKFILSDNCSFVVRPSGTEPKIKVYVSVASEDEEAAKMTEEKLMEDIGRVIAAY